MPSTETQQYDVPAMVEVLICETFTKKGFEWDIEIYSWTVEMFLTGSHNNWSYEELLERVKEVAGDHTLAVQYVALNLFLGINTDYLCGKGISVESLTLEQAQNHYQAFIEKSELNSPNLLDIASSFSLHPENN